MSRFHDFLAFWGLVDPEPEAPVQPFTRGPGESERDFRRRVWHEQSVGLRNLAVDTLRHDRWFLRRLEQLRQLLERYPDSWWEAGLVRSTKFDVTMQLRLRRDVCPDSAVSGGSWETIWVSAVEAAIREEHYVT